MVLTGSVVLLTVLAKCRRRNRHDCKRNGAYAAPKQLELAANNLKAATREVDNSGEEVELALSMLTASLTLSLSHRLARSRSRLRRGIAESV